MTNKFAYGFVEDLGVQWYVKAMKNPLLARKIWTSHLELPATPYSNMHLQLVLV